MTTPNELSDKALAVFAFALYHQLSSGEVVSAVTVADGAGHRIDDKATTELTGLGLAQTTDEKLIFTPAGALMLSQLVDRLRGRW